MGWEIKNSTIQPVTWLGFKILGVDKAKYILEGTKGLDIGD